MHSSLENRLEHGEHAAFGKAKRRDINGPDGHLAKLEEFEGHSLRAEWKASRNTTWQHRKYFVYSYSTVIAIYVPDRYRRDYGALYVNERDYGSNKTNEHRHNALVWTGRDLHHGDIPVVVCDGELDTISAAWRL